MITSNGVLTDNSIFRFHCACEQHLLNCKSVYVHRRYFVNLFARSLVLLLCPLFFWPLYYNCLSFFNLLFLITSFVSSNCSFWILIFTWLLFQIIVSSENILIMLFAHIENVDIAISAHGTFIIKRLVSWIT